MRASETLRVAAMLAMGFAGGMTYQWISGLGTPAIAAEAMPQAPAVRDAGTKEVRATRFVLVDDVGNVKAELGDFKFRWPVNFPLPPGASDMTGLVIYSESGKPAVQLGKVGDMSRAEFAGPAGWASYGVTGDGAGMGLWCPEETLRFGMGFQKPGNGGVTMLDLQNRERFSLGMPAQAGFSMSLKDEAGEKVWEAP